MPDANLSEQEWHALLDEEGRRSREAFTKPVKSFEDAALLGAVAMFWNFAHHDEIQQAERRRLLTQSDSRGMGSTVACASA